ncbi:MAG: FAD-dependent oxidoreductase, partial [Gemmatimonadetes bacterium]|nr:FAD-dependent oxidoreductase [Gemmatimonadota bacterium]
SAGVVHLRRLAKVTVVESARPSCLATTTTSPGKPTPSSGRLDIRTGTKATGATVEESRVLVTIDKDGATEVLDADYVLVSVGRRPALHGVDAAALGLHVGPRGEVIVDDQMRTNLPNVFAIGDVVGGKLLAHKAEEEGVVAAEVIAGKPAHMHYDSIPGWSTPGLSGDRRPH